MEMASGRKLSNRIDWLKCAYCCVSAARCPPRPQRSSFDCAESVPGLSINWTDVLACFTADVSFGEARGAGRRMEEERREHTAEIQ